MCSRKLSCMCRFQKLQTLNLEQNKITGQLPPQWGSGTAFPALINLILGNNDISGALLQVNYTLMPWP